jgi:hypothetical protein
MIEPHFPVVRDADCLGEMHTIPAINESPLPKDSRGSPRVEASADFFPRGGRHIEIPTVTHLLPVAGDVADRNFGRSFLPTRE